MSNLPLRKSGPLVRPYGWPMTPKEDPPRALKALSRIIEDELCHRCGSCIGICPTSVLGTDHRDYPTVKNLSACTDCDLCVKVCPGDELDVKSIAQQMFGSLPEVNDMHGQFESAFLAYANDEEVRQKSTSGGLVTGLLISLLRRGEIDGAVVIAADPDVPWKGKPIVARSEEEVLAATKSKYAISPTNAVFSEIRETKGRYAVVGLPCQIHGLHKAARLDRRIRERVVLSIGLFCHAAIDHEPFELIWDSLGDCKDKVEKFISRIGKHPGTPHVQLRDGTMQPVYFPKAKSYRPSSMEILNILYRLYTPPRCLTCYDATAEFADIAVGDPWMPRPSDDVDFYQGYSFVLSRTEKAESMLSEAKAAGDISLVKLTREAAKTSNVMMGTEKRYRAFRVIETRRRQGHAIPDYGFPTPRSSGKQKILTECNMLSHVFCYLPFGQKSVLRFILSPGGYGLLWLNNKKRRFRDWRKNFRALLKRRVTKQSGIETI